MSGDVNGCDGVCDVVCLGLLVADRQTDGHID